MTMTDAGDLTALVRWLDSEIAASQLTPSAFAQRAGIHHSVLSRIMRMERQPRLETLQKLSEATHTSLSVLVKLAFPEYEYGSGPSAAALLLAQQLEGLPDDVQQKLVELASITAGRK